VESPEFEGKPKGFLVFGGLLFNGYLSECYEESLFVSDRGGEKASPWHRGKVKIFLVRGEGGETKR